ncbi:HEPN domain-containing protein [Serratia sp. D1N4]
MEWMMLPFNKHSDDGFGVMAESFKESAEVLLKHPEDNFFGVELSACYLLRHACELYLKSLLIVTHRYLLNQDKKSAPKIKIKDKIKPLTTVHNLKALYYELSMMLNHNSDKLEKTCRTNWLPLPPELTEAISTIDALDEGSFFFRYPDTKGTNKDELKSKYRKVHPEELMSWDTEKRGYLKALVLVDDNDNITESFNYQNEIFTDELNTLKVACDWLECFHVGLRQELAGGR